jgi:peptidoglycan-N-acetylglucosamine deacetylase
MGKASIVILRITLAAMFIIAATFGPVSPLVESASAQQYAPGPERVYFSPTGHYLEGEFLEFWWEYGGMPVFGFPVTPEFKQDGMTVQYFERAVLQKHPDNPPEWQILLRRLGAQARTSELREHWAFQRQSEAETGLYFPETGQNLRYGFKEHWEKNGGIRIFGYPISAEFEQDGFTVQYFERAIFEYHPDNPPEWRVLQPLIGAQAAREDGVDRQPSEHDSETPEYHPNLWRQPPPKVVYLTFDDGPHSTWTPLVLDILAEFDAEATFFVLGQLAEINPGLIQRIASEGHTIANHSYSHPSMAGMSFAQFQWQVQATENAVRPYRMAPCLRPPYGAMDGNTRSFARALGYDVILWDVDPQDWALPGTSTIYNRVVSHTRNGSVVLLHDGGINRSQTVSALRPIMQQLSAQGYQFKALCQ